MAEDANNPVESAATPNLPAVTREGEGSATQAGSIDLADQRDRGLLRQASRKRWPVSEDFKARAAAALDRAMVAASEKGEVGEIVDCVRTLAVIEKQNQDDEHLAEKHGRIDLGKATERVDGTVQSIVMRVVGPERPQNGG